MAYLTHAPVVSRLPSPVALIGTAANTLLVWIAVTRERRALREMSLTQLDDLGMNEAAARAEIRKPFWVTHRPI